jgi:hypothetical protein
MLWRIFQLSIIIGVTTWLVGILRDHPEIGVPTDSWAPSIYGMLAAYVATLILAKAIDLARRLWRG